MEYPHCDSCICNLFCYRKKVFIQSVSNGDHEGFPCPGCGLTRAMFMVLRGDFAGAWKMHPFIYGVIILVGWFGVRRYIQRKGTKSLGKWVILLCVGLILYYVYRMVRYFPGDAPMSYYYGSVGYRVWEIIRSGRNYL